MRRHLRAAVDPPLASPRSYQRDLRILGRHLDLGGYRTVTICEVAAGFLVHATPRVGIQPVLLELVDQDIPRLVATSLGARGDRERYTSRPVLPTGYEDFLRALGRWLDQRQMGWITLSERQTEILVRGWPLRDGYSSTHYEAVEAVIDQA